MSGQYRRGGSGAPRGPLPSRRATKAEVEFNQRVKAEAEKPLRQYVRFLENTLDAKSGESWNLYTLVMALHRFGKKCGGKPYGASPTLLLERFAERFIGNTEAFNAQAVGNAFYGLRGIDTAMLEPAGLAALTKVLNVLADKAGTCTEPLSAQEVGNAFYGLQGIDTAMLDPAGLAAFARVLNVLADKAGTCTEPLSAQEVGNAFYGLRRSLTAPATQAVANMIATQLVTRMPTPAQMKASRAAVVCGLSCALRCGHDACPALAAGLDQLWVALEAVLGGLEDQEAATPIGWQALMESQQVYALYSWAIPAVIEQMFKKHRAGCEEFLTESANKHTHEKAVSEQLQELLGVPVQAAVLHSGFELDLRCSHGGQVYNIELDGPHHQKLAQRLNDAQRDRWLEEARIRVIRVPLTPGLGPKQLAQQVAAELQNRAERA